MEEGCLGLLTNPAGVPVALGDRKVGGFIASSVSPDSGVVPVAQVTKPVGSSL